MNAQKIETKLFVALILSVKIYLVATNVNVHKVLVGIHIPFVKNAIILNVNVSNLTKLLMEIVCYLDVPTVKNVRQALNVYKYQMELTIVLVQKVFIHFKMDLVKV